MVKQLEAKPNKENLARRNKPHWLQSSQNKSTNRPNANRQQMNTKMHAIIAIMAIGLILIPVVGATPVSENNISGGGPPDCSGYPPVTDTLNFLVCYSWWTLWLICSLTSVICL
jgi:hypothetical protein